MRATVKSIRWRASAGPGQCAERELSFMRSGHRGTGRRWRGLSVARNSAIVLGAGKFLFQCRYRNPQAGLVALYGSWRKISDITDPDAKIVPAF